MTQRVSTLVSGRKERLERLLGRSLHAPKTGPRPPLPQRIRGYLLEEAQDLYWNELAWENITEEEALEGGGSLTELAFPGFLAFIRGLLLKEVMPDALAPASPRPEVVVDVTEFLAGRVVELEECLAAPDVDNADGLRADLDMTSRLIDLVLYLYHELKLEDVERLEAARKASA